MELAFENAKKVMLLNPQSDEWDSCLHSVSHILGNWEIVTYFKNVTLQLKKKLFILPFQWQYNKNTHIIKFDLIIDIASK